MTTDSVGIAPNIDPAFWHPALVRRWEQLAPNIEALMNCRVRVVEGYRPNSTSPHGFVLPVQTEEWPNGVPAAAALDFVVDEWDPGSPPWLHLTRLLEIGAPLARYGLIYKRAASPTIQVQMVEWSDVTHNLVV